MSNARLWHPWLRINRVLHAILHTRWSAEAWPQINAEFKKAIALRSQIRRAGWFNQVRVQMARQRPAKKPEPAPPAASPTLRALPMNLQTDDRITDETGEWEVIGRPYTTAGGKNARIRVRRVGESSVTELRTWGAHERISVRRA